MKNVEEDVIRLTSGRDTGDMYYQTITGLKQALTEVQQDAKLGEESSLNPGGHSNSAECESGSGTDEDEEEENSSDSEGSGYLSETKSQQVPIDKKAARKENKKKVKEEKREARKNKVPKATKKKRKKMAKAHKTR